MYLISAEGCKCKCSHFNNKSTGEIWSSMKCVGTGMGVKNISDVVLKEIHF